MRVTRAGLALGGAAAVLALAGCGTGGTGGTGGDGGDGAAAVPSTATGSLEKLAAEVKCKPDIQTDADEIRQALCDNTDGEFVLATFATDGGQREWLNGAKDYGGYYLVGRKWVAVGKEKTVNALQTTLGGTMEEGSEHLTSSPA